MEIQEKELAKNYYFSQASAHWAVKNKKTTYDSQKAKIDLLSATTGNVGYQKHQHKE